MDDIRNSENLVCDADGNVYDSVAVGNQIWMAENLRVTRYSNGDPLSEFDVNNWFDPETGELLSKGSGDYSYSENDKELINRYGCLYNWHAVNDARRIAPPGWHIPSVAEWKQLFDFLGGELVAADKLKSTGFSNWGSRKTGSDNSSGFSAVPAGFRNIDGSFKGSGYYAYWWTATESDDLRSWICYLSYARKYATFKKDLKCYGFSIRCIRDNYG